MLGANEDGEVGDQRRMRLGQAAAELCITHLELKGAPQGRPIQRDAGAVCIEAVRAQIHRSWLPCIAVQA